MIARRVAALAVTLVVACSDDGHELTARPPPGGAPIGVATPEDPVEPLRAPVGLDPARVALGARLFADPILHERGAVACTHCHDRTSGADPRARSVIEGQPPTGLNTLTVLNASLNYRFNWTGRFTDLESQLDVPLLSPNVMATTFPRILERLGRHPEYPAAFASAYPDGLTEANVRDALVAHVRSLVTLDAPFDRWLNGDEGALTPDERAGYATFKSHGCISCHQGANLGGNMVQRLGVMADYFALRGGPITDADLGLYGVTRREADRHVFRVPGLRNVALTAPYFHDGSAATLEEAVRTMSEVQLGRPLEAEQTRLLVAFLRSLTGKPPAPPPGAEPAATADPDAATRPGVGP